MLPIAAAIGGMVVPALCYAVFNAGGEGARGWGIPMATDIRHVWGTAWLAGIGFRMALFISGLAFTGIGLDSQAKLGILRGLLVSAVLGILILLTTRPDVGSVPE